MHACTVLCMHIHVCMYVCMLLCVCINAHYVTVCTIYMLILNHFRFSKKIFGLQDPKYKYDNVTGLFSSFEIEAKRLYKRIIISVYIFDSTTSMNTFIHSTYIHNLYTESRQKISLLRRKN
jgi:hypothetical protein